MTQRRIEPRDAGARLDPIATIARQERLTRDVAFDRATIGDRDAEDRPDLVPAAAALAPQGLSGLVERALGRMTPPGLLELANALEDLQGHVSALADVDPALAEVTASVLADEQRKVLRYVDLRDRR